MQTSFKWIIRWIFYIIYLPLLKSAYMRPNQSNSVLQLIHNLCSLHIQRMQCMKYSCVLPLQTYMDTVVSLLVDNSGDVWLTYANLQTTIVFNSYLFSISLNTYNFDHNLFLHRPIRFSPDTFFRRYVFSPILFFADTFWRRYVFSQRYVMSTIRVVRRRLGHIVHNF